MPNVYQVSLKGIIAQENRILIVRGKLPSGKSFWDLPGGRMEKGESVEKALIREVTEELPTLTSPKIIKLIDATADRHLEDGMDLVTLFYLFEGTLPNVTLSNEHTDYLWVSADQLKSIKENTGDSFFAGFERALTLAFNELV